MQFSLSNADIKTFLHSGSLALEEVISKEEASLLSFKSKERDPHRTNLPLSRLVSSRRLSLMAANLTHTEHLRIAFTEWSEGPLKPLTEWSSIQPLTIALLLQPDRSALFINPTIPLEIPPGLLIVYAPLIALYTYNPLDLYVHELKKYGYAFGDRLGNHTHPLVCKDFFS